MYKPSIPKGMRDFSPEEMARRNYIFNTIRSVYHRFGFSQIETPTMENLSTLMGKYGEEGDKLLFKVLNSGDFTTDVTAAEFDGRNAPALAAKMCEKGLRYDLTVPFARYVVMHRNELTFPFRRFQIQPVWRADRPQKGRYREFYQCDADVVGSDSLLNEVEIVQMIDAVFDKLNIRVAIKINNRKVLSGIAEVIGAPDKIVDITVAIDKMDKIGIEKVNDELRAKGIADEAIAKLQPIVLMSGDNDSKINTLRSVLATSETGMKGVGELEYVFGLLKGLSVKATVDFDVALARGLSYYTGAIFEVKALDVQIGSIAGGGRYDNLTGIFGLPDVSGVGISFGADRIYDVLLQLGGFPEASMEQTRTLFVRFGDAELAYILPVVSALRGEGVNIEVYPENAKMKKQLSYADSKGIPYVVLVGEDEMKNDLFMLKNMAVGEQKAVDFEQLKVALKGKG